ncbi:MAG: hypothetical protein AB8C02_04200 [Halioglobus sp.]
MNQPLIRELIEIAVEQESKHGRLNTVLRQRLPELESALVLPADAPVAALVRFVTRYIRSVPSCLRLVTAVSKRQGFFEYAAPFIRLAEDYFLQPPDEVGKSEGLEALLDEAFLAHRLLEEVNDSHIKHLQRPLLPFDMTEANIIVHHLIGDDLATRLEQLVDYTASGLLRHERAWQTVKAGATSGYPELKRQELAPQLEEIRLRLAS